MVGHEVWVPGSGGASGPTQHMMSWAYAGGSSRLGHLTTEIFAGGGNELFEFDVPDDFGSVDSLVVNIIPTATDAAHDIDLASSYGATGEACNTHTETNNVLTYALTLNQFFALNLLTVFANLAAGDHCGIDITNNDVADNIHVTTIELVYTYA